MNWKSSKMSINEKNKRVLNTLQSSQWKIVPGPDESDDVQVAQNPIGQETIMQEARPARQDFRHRLLRDATAFYRNDTSRFLGELQKAESLLHQKVNLISKIDFLPPKRKTHSQQDHHEAQGRGFDKQLSDTDSDIVTVQRIERKNRKKDEPEKLIVDVNDFIDTFSVAREPVYQRVSTKKASDNNGKSEYDFLLDQVSQKRENDGIHDTIDHIPPVDIVENNVTENANRLCEPSIISQDVLPFVDDPFVILDALHLQTSFAITTVEDAYPCHSDIPQAISENNQQQESWIEREEIRETGVSEEQTLPEKNIISDEDHICNVRNVTVKEIEVDEVVSWGEESEVVAKIEVPPPVVAQLPGILERLGEFAGDQCDILADYIKDRVYDGSRMIAFCGMQRSVGCSTMTLLAAKGIMRLGLKTAVVDANFEFPNLNTVITGQQENDASWVNILHGADDWETLGITPKDMPLLTVFPLAENALVHWSRHKPERLQQETNRFVALLQEYFDLILLDCGCFENTFEEITWGELALFQPDGVILVHNPKEIPLEMLEPCCREILNSGINTFGIAENFV
jgi:hypothetical protein